MMISVVIPTLDRPSLLLRAFVAIGVKTGNGCRDCGVLDSPDRLVEDLWEAVEIILASSGRAQP
jgi:hypothetical protein